MVSQCFALYESAMPVSSHHGAPLSARATRKRRHENRCRGSSSHTKASSHTGLESCALYSLFVILFFWGSMFSVVSAAGSNGDRPAMHVQDDLAWTGSLLSIDQQPPPIVPASMPPVHGNQDATETQAKRSIATDSSAADADFKIPQPFDTGLSNNFTSSCTNFLNRLRTSDSFENCHPFSLMLQVRWEPPIMEEVTLVVVLTQHRLRVIFLMHRNHIFGSRKLWMQPVESM